MTGEPADGGLCGLVQRRGYDDVGAAWLFPAQVVLDYGSKSGIAGETG